mgnify:CR=1 FL=1
MLECQCACTVDERRMSIMIVAKQRRARSADHDIMGAKEIINFQIILLIRRGFYDTGSYEFKSRFW